MAYQSYNITAMTDIPALVASFAALQGWTVTGGNTYTHPSLGTAISAVLSNPTGTSLRFAPSEAGAPTATIAVPNINGGVTPTKLHIFCSLTPQPFIALCVEFGFNLYRHLYFGYMEKIGSYNGGEVVAASQHEDQSNTSLKNKFDRMTHQYLFNGHQSRTAANDGGGVRVNHANNANLWRKFDESTGTLNLATEYLDTKAFGGFKDNVNDGFLAHGQSPFLGANILTPINLIAPRFNGANPHMVPIGRPAGVRLVNMKDLEPGAQIVVGGQNWRVFAAHSKDASDTPTYGVGSYPTKESSHYVGYAYPEN